MFTASILFLGACFILSPHKVRHISFPSLIYTCTFPLLTSNYHSFTSVPFHLFSSPPPFHQRRGQAHVLVIYLSDNACSKLDHLYVHAVDSRHAYIGKINSLDSSYKAVDVTLQIMRNIAACCLHTYSYRQIADSILPPTNLNYVLPRRRSSSLRLLWTLAQRNSQRKSSSWILQFRTKWANRVASSAFSFQILTFHRSVHFW